MGRRIVPSRSFDRDDMLLVDQLPVAERCNHFRAVERNQVLSGVRAQKGLIHAESFENAANTGATYRPSLRP